MLDDERRGWHAAKPSALLAAKVGEAGFLRRQKLLASRFPFFRNQLEPAVNLGEEIAALVQPDTGRLVAETVNRIEPQAPGFPAGRHRFLVELLCPRLALRQQAQRPAWRRHQRPRKQRQFSRRSGLAEIESGTVERALTLLDFILPGGLAALDRKPLCDRVLQVVMSIHRERRGDSALVEDDSRPHRGTASPIVVFKEVLARSIRHAAFRVESRAIAAQEAREDLALDRVARTQRDGRRRYGFGGLHDLREERERRAGRSADVTHRKASPESGYHPTPSNSPNRRTT